jgi:hypothetical protein
MRIDDQLSFKGYRMNAKGVILKHFNPLLLPPAIGILFFPFTPVRIAFFVLICGIFVLDFADIRPTEAFRGFMRRIKKVNVVSCSATHKDKLNNLKRMGF